MIKGNKIFSLPSRSKSSANFMNSIITLSWKVTWRRKKNFGTKYYSIWLLTDCWEELSSDIVGLSANLSTYSRPSIFYYNLFSSNNTAVLCSRVIEARLITNKLFPCNSGYTWINKHFEVGVVLRKPSVMRQPFTQSHCNLSYSTWCYFVVNLCSTLRC